MLKFIQGLERGKTCRQAWGGHLVDVLRPDEILQAMRAQILQVHSFGKRLIDKLIRCLTDEDLPALADTEQPPQPVENRTNIVIAPLLGHASMKRHPDPQGSDLTPWLRLQEALRVEGGMESITGSIERDLKGVADHLVHVAPVPGRNRTQDRFLTDKGIPHPFRVCLPPVGAAFDIGEKEGNGA